MTDLAERRGIETDLYEPAEDSALLADAATREIESTDLVLDVGTGSGFVAAEIASAVGARVIGTDVNPHACRRTADAGIEVVRGNLVDPFAAERFDVITFNPPYLPADEDAARDDWMEVALTGGETGREVIEPFLESVGRVLAPDGIVLLLVSTLTGIEEVTEVASDAGFSAVAVAEESFPFETLVILKLVR